MTVAPPIEPMLAKIADEIPEGAFLYEPKWDGFRAIVFRDDDIYIQSRDLRPFDRYFPDLHEALRPQLPEDCVIVVEIVIATADGLDFDALQLRLHPAASRVEKLARETPASFVAFDALAANGRDLRRATQEERRRALEQLLADAKPPLYVTPVTRDRKLAQQWLQRFEGAGLDGVIAKPLDLAYQPGKRAMLKVKHVRTADCVVAGFRWHKQGEGIVGSLLLGLYGDDGRLHHVGVAASFPMAKRKALVAELEPYVADDLSQHPWGEWADQEAHASTRMPGAVSRWSAGKNLSFVPLRPELVVEVAYEKMEGDRFRHTAQFRRWRTDRTPESCTYEQLESPDDLALSEILPLQG